MKKLHAPTLLDDFSEVVSTAFESKQHLQQRIQAIEKNYWSSEIVDKLRIKLMNTKLLDYSGNKKKMEKLSSLIIPYVSFELKTYGDAATAIDYMMRNHANIEDIENAIQILVETFWDWFFEW